jgi:hypothetical protein
VDLAAVFDHPVKGEQFVELGRVTTSRLTFALIVRADSVCSVRGSDLEGEQ